MFARDSSINVPDGPIVTQCAQWWRRGEYAAVIRFYQEHDIPIADMVTAGSLEGGDFMIVEPGVAAIGTGEERTQEQAARQVAGWLEAQGWEVRVERIPPHFLHIDVLACMLGEKLAAVCVEQASNGFVSWLESKSVEIVPGHASPRRSSSASTASASAATGCSPPPSPGTSTSACARSA